MSGPAGRRRAVAVAGHVGDEATAAKGLVDADAGVRASALGALGRLGRLDAPTLARALADSDAGVRRRACEEAARHDTGGGQGGDRQVIDAVGARLGDDDPSVVEAAAFALGEVLGDADGRRCDGPAPEAVARLEGVVRGHDDPLCREAAVAALGAIGHPAGLEAVIAATDDKPAVRRRAVLALAPFAGPAVDDALARARTDRDWQVRQAAEDLA